MKVLDAVLNKCFNISFLKTFIIALEKAFNVELHICIFYLKIYIYTSGILLIWEIFYISGGKKGEKSVFWGGPGGGLECVSKCSFSLKRSF